MFNDIRLGEFTSGASHRFTKVHVSVSQFVDLAAYRASLQNLRENAFARAVLANLTFQQPSVQSRWNVWLSRPFQRKVDYYRPPERLIEMTGGDEEHYWYAFPCEKSYVVLDASPPSDPGESVEPFFRTWLPPEVAELLDPAFIWVQPEGYKDDPIITCTGSGMVLGRETIYASLHISDWATRGIGWSETLLAAEKYELILDKVTGILLQVDSILGSRRISTYKVDSLVLDAPMEPRIFNVNNWIDEDWVQGGQRRS